MILGYNVAVQTDDEQILMSVSVPTLDEAHQAADTLLDMFRGEPVTIWTRVLWSTD